MMNEKKERIIVKKMNIRTLTSVGLLSTLAYLLMLLNFPIPPFPSFLMIDFSDIPALIAAIIFGPLAGIMVELVKNVLDFFMTGSPTGVPVGHLANFVAGITFILPVYYVYKKFESKKGLTVALAAGAVFMAVMMSVLNYYVILPAYTLFLNAPAMSAPETKEMVVSAILPFNMIKGIVMAVVFLLIYSRIYVWMRKQAAVS
ncbi:Substrate-specific component RibU of riboflavin ECF transporter [Bacillus badius]|uniref:Riboflavin transporter n=1 Tax=Bacillus badius TaxID=1455 RepID=A0ABR5AYN4_BACBA|nr:Substrate-specific component RibU of riboflavin ECF transporter [Bacillus badius]KIL79843.1 Substrate-specific component RibU of riboflavin ECF transporter [Bacillus badius]